MLDKASVLCYGMDMFRRSPERRASPLEQAPAEQVKALGFLAMARAAHDAAGRKPGGVGERAEIADRIRRATAAARAASQSVYAAKYKEREGTPEDRAAASEARDFTKR